MQNNVSLNPLYIEIILNTNNYYDRKFLNKLKQVCDSSEFTSGIYSRKTVDEVMKTYFHNEIAKFYQIDDTSELIKNSTSIYFIEQILVKNPTVSFFKVNIDKNTSYTRKVQKDDGSTYIELSNKWIICTLDFYKFAKDEEELLKFNEDLCIYSRIEIPSFYKPTQFNIDIDKFCKQYIALKTLIETKYNRSVSSLTELLYESFIEYNKKYEFNIISILTEWEM